MLLSSNHDYKFVLFPGLPNDRSEEHTSELQSPEAPKVAELLEIVDDKADIEETTTIINEDNQARVEVKYVPVQAVSYTHLDVYKRQRRNIQ